MKKYLLFSDLHGNEGYCKSIVEKSSGFDVAIGAGDFALFRKGLSKTIEMISEIEIPTILVPGNHESLDELNEACKGIDNFHILHGSSIELQGVLFLGIGCGIPEVPFPWIDWSVDLSEEDARNFLKIPEKEFVFITHSPPYGCLDKLNDDRHVGSRTITTFIEESRPDFVVCGHIHESWNRIGSFSGIPVINCGPFGYEFQF